MKQIFVNKGKILTEDVPVKKIETGFVKVKTVYSCISMGTELSSIASSGKSIIGRIKENPEYITRGLKLLKEKGVNGTRGAINNSFDRWNSLGYSAAGVVEEVAADVNGILPGDRVACAGGNYATHSEFMVVPKNLIVKIPDTISLRDASSVAIGSIAMQGVRRADVKIGENVCVIGLGLIGQLTVQILKAAGAHVIAIDVNEDRIRETEKLGADFVINSSAENMLEMVSDITDGMGVDSVIITAATHSSQPLKQAFSICRKRGRVVLVGVVDINIDRSDMYEKELEFLISTSYGPGRYDANYEEKGIDYPYHWVRFTENRNMKEYLSLLADHKVDLKNMFADDVSVQDAEAVYNSLVNTSNRPLMQVFKYEECEKQERPEVLVLNPAHNRNKGIKVAVCGVGGFAKNFHLPNLSKIDEFEIYAIMSRDGGNAKKAAVDYNASIATTSYDQVITDKAVDAVLITTRHNLHYSYITKALKADKMVFVEKPLCMNKEELDDIKNILLNCEGGLMVGYNRRFSPHATLVKSHLKNRINPMIINYVMNAGYIPPDNWVHGEEGGGRVIGEACHIFDLFSYFTEEHPVSIYVNAISPSTQNVSNRDNLVVSIKYDRGSVATLTYCANGNRNFAKETCQIFCDNNTYMIDDYKETVLYEGKIQKFATKGADKGHLKELEEFAIACKQGNRFLIPLDELIETSNISFVVDGLLK